MKFYKVTAVNNGSRVTVSQPNLTKQKAENMASELKLNPYFKDVLIEKSAAK